MFSVCSSLGPVTIIITRIGGKKIFNFTNYIVITNSVYYENSFPDYVIILPD